VGERRASVVAELGKRGLEDQFAGSDHVPEVGVSHVAVSAKAEAPKETSAVRREARWRMWRRR
jgi:hypothetical protein